MSNEKKVCLITGVGPGTGAALAKRFAAGNYRVAMLARDAKRLNELTQTIENSAAFTCDVSDAKSLETTVATIKDSLGPVHIVIHNAVSANMCDFLDLDPDDFRRNFETNTVALLRLAQLTAPDMIERGEGVIMATGNTSAYRGKAKFAGFAPTKAAQRILIESIARAAGPKGVHAVYVAIDAVIDVPWTRKAFADKPNEYFCQPDDIAEECFHVAHQRKSTWSSDVVLRPYGENW
ncbi:MAG: SDR family NAD(P)-dependent oxidoreductase [Gammaproteobacteria bacterium]